MLLRIRLASVIILFCSACMALNSLAASKASPLAPDQAFALAAKFTGPQQLSVEWQIAPGYYLYSQKLHISASSPALQVNATFPKPLLKADAARPSFTIYTGKLVVPIQLLSTKDIAQTQLQIDYQGCSEAGFCYPPMQKTFFLNLPTQTLSHEAQLSGAASNPTLSLRSLLTDQNGVQALFTQRHLIALLAVFAALGLLLAFTPCVLPMIPILTSIIVGHKHKLSTKRAFLLSLIYVIGSALTYACAGVVAALMGSSLQAWLQQPIIIGVTGCLFLLLAISLFGFYDLQLPRRLQYRITSISRKQEGGTYFGVFIMGIISTLIVSPCVTAPLVGVLMYIGQTGDVIIGASALFAMGLGMGFPLLLIGMSAGKVLPRTGPWMEWVKKFFGVLMIGMAVWLFMRIPTHSTVNVTSPTIAAASGEFTVVRNLTDLNHQLTLAKAAHKPVILDFYADWCESCVAMEKNVFALPTVKLALDSFVLIRADLSANSTADETLLKTFAVVAPPTVIFFNNIGTEQNSRRIVGAVNAHEFLGRIDTFLSANCDKKLAC